jgi:hypothetical protein
VVLPVLLMIVGGLGLAVVTYVGVGRRPAKAKSRSAKGSSEPTRESGHRAVVAPLRRDRRPCQHVVRFVADDVVLAPVEVERLERFLDDCPVGTGGVSLRARVVARDRILVRRRAAAVTRQLWRIGVRPDRIHLDVQVGGGGNGLQLEVGVQPAADRRR